MKSLMVTLVVFASLGTATICFANSGKKAAAKMTPQQIEKVCKEEVQSGAQKEVDRQEAQAKAANNRGFSKEKALATVKKDIYEGCMKSHK